jgi:phosphoglycolate phosphatase
VLAIATGRRRVGLMRDLASTGLGPSFATTRTADEAEPKPHPQMLLDVLEALGKTPAETVMIGDTTYDLEMAKRAEVAAVGVLTGSHERHDLEQWNPLACLPTVADLPAYLTPAVPAP